MFPSAILVLCCIRVLRVEAVQFMHHFGGNNGNAFASPNGPFMKNFRGRPLALPGLSFG